VLNMFKKCILILEIDCFKNCVYCIEEILGILECLEISGYFRYDFYY